MRVLHIISSGGMYGAEAVILNLSQCLNEGPHKSMLAVFSNTSQPNMQLYDLALKRGIEAYVLPCRGQIDLSVLEGIRELVRVTGTDVVHAHGYKADLYAYAALRARPTPLVSTCHTWYDNDFVVRVYGWLDRYILRRYAGVVAVSEQVRQRLLDAGVRKERIHLIRNGIDLRPFSTVSRSRAMRCAMEGELTVGLAGRLAPEKGIDLFLRAATEVLAQMPQIRFVVAGEGRERGSLEALLATLGIGRSVLLLGRTEDMAGFLGSVDVLVSSSRQEGLPITLLEGMASGAPIVATAVGAVPSVVRDGKTGVLVQAGDVPGLAQGILGLLQDAAARKRYGLAGQQLVADEFSAERMTADYLALYQMAGAGKR